ncbi:hypothetical protein Tco_0836689 [Tanacetum coccineum]
MEILPFSTLRIDGKHLKLLMFTSMVHVNSLLSYLERESANPDLGMAVEYQRTLLASLDVKVSQQRLLGEIVRQRLLSTPQGILQANFHDDA